jgi:non-ribosomal peptide synthetase component F
MEHLVTENDLHSRSIPLGKPMANVHIYLLDEYLQPVVPGIQMGEIIIGGMFLYFSFLKIFIFINFLK